MRKLVTHLTPEAEKHYHRHILGLPDIDSSYKMRITKIEYPKWHTLKSVTTNTPCPTSKMILAKNSIS